MKRLALNEIIFEGQLYKDTFCRSRRAVEKGLYVTVQLRSNSIRAESLQRFQWALSLGEHHAGYSASPAPDFWLLCPGHSLGPVFKAQGGTQPWWCHCSHVFKGSVASEWHMVAAGLAHLGPSLHLLPTCTSTQISSRPWSPLCKASAPEKPLTSAPPCLFS